MAPESILERDENRSSLRKTLSLHPFSRGGRCQGRPQRQPDCQKNLLREHSFFRRGGWAGGIPMSMDVKSRGPPFIFGVKKCDPPSGSSKIYSDPLVCCVKFMLTLPFWAGKRLMTSPEFLRRSPTSKKWMLPSHNQVKKDHHTGSTYHELNGHEQVNEYWNQHILINYSTFLACGMNELDVVSPNLLRSRFRVVTQRSSPVRRSVAWRPV